MAASDITVSGLNKVGAEDAAYLVSKIRTIPGFPKEGILFRDFMPVLADARAFGILMGALEAALPVDVDDFDMVAGLEARGFLFGPALAARLGKGFIAVRKAGKLPPETMSQSYDLEYGQASMEIETNVVHEGVRVLIVDDRSPPVEPPMRRVASSRSAEASLLDSASSWNLPVLTA